MGLIQNIGKLLDEATKTGRKANEISKDVITGKKKLAEVQIISRGGPGVSAFDKKVHKKALKNLERRMRS